MDKMKDAFQNLLSKVKPQQQPEQSGQQQDQKGQQGKSQQGAKQQNGKDGQQQNAGQQGEAQEGENGEQAKNDENAQQQKGQGKSDSQQTTKQPGSGVGSQDGDKAIKNAEQLAAMGKLSEIMGKRSQNITGEATVEVQSTNQQLRTNYVQQGRAAHAGRRGDQPRRSAGGSTALRAAIFRAGPQAGRRAVRAEEIDRGTIDIAVYERAVYGTKLSTILGRRHTCEFANWPSGWAPPSKAMAKRS